MGRFEDLLAKARDGDTAALDELEQEFSGSSLRKTAEESSEEAKALKTWQEQTMPLVRKAKFDELVSGLDDSLKNAGLTVGDFGEFDPTALTVDQVKAQAQAKLEAKSAQRLALAKEAGFETVEEFDKVIQAAKQEKEENLRLMEAVGRTASSGSDAGKLSDNDSRYQTALSDFKSAKALGQTNDEAMGEMVHTLLAQQAPKLVE